MALADFLSDFMLIREVVQADDLGTHTEAYNKVLNFKGAVTTMGSAEGKKGEQSYPSSNFQLTTYKEVALKFNDIIKDLDTGLYYQLVTDRLATPKSAGLSIQIWTVKKITINNVI